MSTIIILLMTMGMLLHCYEKIFKSRKFLLKYISQVGGKKSTVIKLKSEIIIPFVTIHSIFGIVVGYLVFMKETDGNLLVRILLSSIIALSLILMVFILYFIIIVILKEMISMKDTTINFILVYSIVSFSILLAQLVTKKIESPKGFLWISAVLYVVNLVGIGRIIWTIFNKKVLVKSIWSIAIINISFVILSLTNIAFEVQHVYPTACYSRTLTSWGEALYFVVISFFTVGYGDLYPVCEATKILSMVIILSGFTFTAVFVSAALSTTMEHFASREKK